MLTTIYLFEGVFFSAAVGN